MRKLPVLPLTAESFKPFGDVIETRAEGFMIINEGKAQRHHDLATVDVATEGGRPLINIFRASPWDRPIGLRVMERHPLGSQAFISLSGRPFLLVVAPPGDVPGPEDVRAFITGPGQGVNYRRGCWHHPLLVLDQPDDVLVVDRGGSGHNLDEIDVTGWEMRIDW
jgi:ureidoglycolate lyase